MAKALYIAEKPSVAQEFAKALKLEMRNHNGYKEGRNSSRDMVCRVILSR